MYVYACLRVCVSPAFCLNETYITSNDVYGRLMRWEGSSEPDTNIHTCYHNRKEIVVSLSGDLTE